jgi:hypothetical protein
MGTIYYYDKKKNLVYFLKDLEDPINAYIWPFLSDEMVDLYYAFL